MKFEIKTFRVHPEDGGRRHFASTTLNGQDYYLWRDGSLRRCATTRFKKDQEEDAYFENQKNTELNLKHWGFSVPQPTAAGE